LIQEINKIKEEIPKNLRENLLIDLEIDNNSLKGLEKRCWAHITKSSK
jgi:hypothetical protein